MSAEIIDGRAFADLLGGKISSAVKVFEREAGRAPGLAVVLVGSDPASEIYVRSKGKKTRELGMESFEYILPANVDQVELLALIERLNTDDAIDGILIQLPLPRHLDERRVITAIDPSKDVDGLHVVNSGRLVAGIDGLRSCTPLGCMMLLRDRLGDLSGKDAVVIGRSILVGKPMALLLLEANCSVMMVHSRTKNIAEKVRVADIVIAASGQAEMVKRDWIKPGAAVIDVGTTRVQRDGKVKLLGDVAFEEVREVAGYLTPVPGGVGPMTIMTLMHNTLLAAQKRNGLPPADFL